MRLNLYDLIDGDLLDEMLAEGYVSRRDHPAAPLSILNYTARCQYDRVWNDVTRQCRGLIYRNDEVAVVVSRPWAKFFNYGEHENPTDMHTRLDLSASAFVTDKMDGSLGILYPVKGGRSPEYAVATRGSFTSDQAIKATSLLAGMDVKPSPDITYLCEIVYPENRIVVNYGDAEELVLLGGVVTATGEPLPASKVRGWPGRRVSLFLAGTLAEALSMPPRDNAEGLVVQYIDPPHTMVKIKQDDYVALHRIVFGMNERTVWELIAAGKDIDTICEPLPEEFWPWVENVALSLLKRCEAVYNEAWETYCSILSKLDDDMPADQWQRKDFALKAVRHDDVRPYLFMLWDGKTPDQVRAAIWKTLRPSSPSTMVATSEDVA